MPPPADLDELLDRVRKSGLAPMAEVEAIAAAAADHPAGRWTPPDLLDRLVRDQVLTPFQADRIAAGKYKGFVLGSYVILGRVGGGGMGQVYLAEHAEMRRLVAVKVLPVPLTEEPLARERFLREARAAAALDHPHIIKVFDLNREGRLLYLVMEYLIGVNLQELVARDGPLSVEAAVSVAAQVCHGLAHAHERGLVHRDVKPANVLLDATGTAKLLDLGLVRSEADVDSRLTAEYGSAILGTADYVAPEQAVNSSTVDDRADLYSLGATLYFLLAGRPLFPEGGAAQKLMWQQWKLPEPLATFRPDLPPGLWEVVAKAIAKRKEDRHQSAVEFAAALAPFGPPDGVRVPPPAGLMPTVPQRRWMTGPSSLPGTSTSLTSIRLDSGTTTTSLTVTRLRQDFYRVSSPSVIFDLPPANSGAAPTAGLANALRPTPPMTAVPTPRRPPNLAVPPPSAVAEPAPPEPTAPEPEEAGVAGPLLAGLTAGMLLTAAIAFVALKLL